jgi:FAD/FMN-containing dehydrogenase
MAFFERKLQRNPGVQMVYARMNITPQEMFDKVLINMFYPDTGPIPPLGTVGSHWLARAVFRGSVASAFGKDLRWSAETKIQPYLVGKVFSRNQLMNDDAEWYLDRSAERTDILHEYFVPPEGAGQFLAAARKAILKHRGDLLNVTVRDVQTDNDSFLKYASRPMVAFVMFFSQPRTAAGDAQMQEITGELIDAVLEAGGRYYLPYRLHATPAQFHRAYPQASEFFRLKRQYDPQELFENQLYLKYGKETAAIK